jgi:predicted RNA-binding Zn-ribbon protein involved in translation (DUF1610 family)
MSGPMGDEVKALSFFETVKSKGLDLLHSVDLFYCPVCGSSFAAEVETRRVGGVVVKEHKARCGTCDAEIIAIVQVKP